jgi:hypothetical protein
MRITKEDVQDIASRTMRVRKDKNNSYRRFKAEFIFSPSVVAIAWNKLQRKGTLPDGARLKHMLWFLYWVNLYCNKEAGASRCRCNRDTFSKWCLCIAVACSNLGMVSTRSSMADFYSYVV